MIQRVLILILPFYFLVLLQISFLFNIPLVLISIIVINIFFSRFVLESSLTGGFFLDIFSANFIGYNVLIFLALSLLLQFFLRKYVRTS